MYKRTRAKPYMNENFVVQSLHDASLSSQTPTGARATPRGKKRKDI